MFNLPDSGRYWGFVGRSGTVPGSYVLEQRIRQRHMNSMRKRAAFQKKTFPKEKVGWRREKAWKLRDHTQTKDGSGFYQLVKASGSFA